MTSRRIVTRNILWNYAGMAVTMIAGFVSAPFLIDRLGSSTYGLWILIGSFTAYFGLLDLGVRGSVGRFIAFHRARHDDEAVNQSLTTSLGLLCVPAAVTAIATLAAATLFFSLFDVPPEQTFPVRVALLIVGMNLALTFPLSVFDGTLWALQRFDVINSVDVVVVSARTALTFYLIEKGYGLAALAVLTLLATVLGATAKALLSHRIDPKLSIRPSYFRAGFIRDHFGFSAWSFLTSMGRMFTSQLGRILIGSCLGVALVTPFSVAGSLVAYGNALLVACTGVLTPVATSFHAQNEYDKQRRLYLLGGRFCTFFGMCLLGGYLALGKPFISLWIGTDIDATFEILVILALGELLPMSQSITGNILIGAARHKAVAWITLFEASIYGALMIALIHFHGLVGPALATAIAVGVCRGLLVAAYGCRTIGVSVMEFLRQSFLPPLLFGIPLVAVLVAAVNWKTPQNWYQFAVFGCAYCGLCVMLGGILMKFWKFRFWSVSVARGATAPVSQDA